MVAVQMKDVSLTEGISWSDCKEVELEGKREPDYLTAGDILVAARGNHNYAVTVDQLLASTGKQAVAAPQFYVIRLKKSEILPEYVAWLLNQPPAQRYLEQHAEGTSAKSIRRSVLAETPVIVPPWEKQHAIVSMANALKEQHRLVKQLINNSERTMTAIASDLYQTYGH